MSRHSRLFINDVDNCVDEMLQSIALQNPGVRLLQGHRVIIREDVEAFASSGHVSIISGGGSGHEPFAAGFVGAGMLTAAVAGSVFASPPPADIIAAIEASSSPFGTLLIVANYTGDRLNFGIASERAKVLGHNVKMVVVGEDCALESSDKTAGRRGLVGIVTLMKIAGALSEEGKSLDEILSVSEFAAKNMGTIGVSLSGCSIPGSGSSFHLSDSEMELGLGAHGEAGIKRMKIQSADHTVVTMFNHMTNANNASKLDLPSGSKVAVTMNNLGGLSALEMHVLARKLILLLESKNILVKRFYLGHLMTSLDMAGLNFNILKLSDQLTLCLDAQTYAPSWPRTSFFLTSNSSKRNDYVMLRTVPKEKLSGHSIKKEQHGCVTSDTLNCIKSVCEKLISSESHLNELDTACGDGDCGSTLKRGASSILSRINQWNEMSLSNVLLEIATCAEVSMGGASGALYSLFFTAASHHAAKENLITLKNCVDSGTRCIMEYGKAHPGDRTMVDSLVAMIASLNTSIAEKKTSAEALNNAAKDVEDAARKTASMQARAGRASYVAKELLTHPDPGATAVAIVVKCISTFVISS